MPGSLHDVSYGIFVSNRKYYPLNTLCRGRHKIKIYKTYHNQRNGFLERNNCFSVLVDEKKAIKKAASRLAKKEERLWWCYNDGQYLKGDNKGEPQKYFLS